MLSPSQVNQALQAASTQELQGTGQQGGTYAGNQALNLQGAWQNALLQQAAQGWGATNQWIANMYGAQNPYSGGLQPQSMQGYGMNMSPGGSLPVQVNTQPEPSQLTPGLTGGINGIPNYTPYNNGDVSTQVSGQLLTPAGAWNVGSNGNTNYTPAPPVQQLDPSFNQGLFGGLQPFSGLPGMSSSPAPANWNLQPGMMQPGANGFGGYGYNTGGSGPLAPDTSASAGGSSGSSNISGPGDLNFSGALPPGWTQPSNSIMADETQYTAGGY